MKDINIITLLITTIHLLLVEKVEIVLVCLISFIFYWGVVIYYQIKTYTEKYIFLEITPLDVTLQSSLATRELIKILHSLAFPTRHFLFFFQKKVYSLEIHATKYQGIRYVLRIPSQDADMVKKSLYSYLPEIKIQEVSEYLPIQKNTVMMPDVWYGISELSQANHFALPLNSQDKLSQHDPIAYITGNMTKLTVTDSITMQVLITPTTVQTHSHIVKKVKQILHGITREYDVISLLFPSKFHILFLPFFLLRHMIFLCFDILLLPLTFPLFIITLGKTSLLPFSANITEKQIDLTTTQQQMYQDVKNKLDEPLFEATLRFFVIVPTEQEANHRMQGLLSSFSPFASSYQALEANSALSFFKKWINRFNLAKCKYRLPSLMKKVILSASELSDIYHLPYTNTTQTEGMAKIKSRLLPISLQMVNNKEQFATNFAVNTYGQEEAPIGLIEEERRRHVYVLGATGTGKTTLLTTMIYQDILQGRGVCVIDPHGDLTEKILTLVPKKRIYDTIVIDPSDTSFPVGINLLELSNNVDAATLEVEKDKIASHMVSIFSKLAQARFWGPRMENILRIATLTALETEQPTLFTIQRLLLDYKFRNEIVEKLTDPSLILFWKKEFAALGSYQKAAVIAPITNKIARFLTSPQSKYVLSQYHSTIDFTQVMDTKKIILCNLAKGRIGEDTSQLFGSLITAKIQLAALKRVDIPEEERQDFYLYIDEFQNFATPSFAEIMSEARKYRLNAILAHQTIAQIQDQTLLKVILANTGTVICFRTSSPFDQEFILPFFIPQVTQSDLANIPSFYFYMKVNALVPQDAFSGETKPVKNIPNEKIAERIIDSSRSQYTVPKEIVEEKIKSEFEMLLKAEAEAKAEAKRKREEKLGAKKEKLNKRTHKKDTQTLKQD